LLRNWNGELRFLQNFKLKRFSRKSLQHLITCSKSNQEELLTDHEMRSAACVKAPVVQSEEYDPQNDGKTDINGDTVSLDSRKQEIGGDSMNVDST